ncbi:glucose-1-phosphate cytidylyltransferase [Bradyrhizobium sp. Ash2021]|uniref:glucose-1-phosphate cytidylyltransferase n=1 Tax=Bradyrhizobium sp. Ash2021 TaxID=2954771 RepID=UPI002815BBAA|nr:glucose-1-phosphate cytidylyltransferase [Bradyrhizobium sp. Ash2021]WMT72544.1 glucose-1-phosphate cytidylyltransferase [Bradyrhizobium sp. Ash2021]
MKAVILAGGYGSRLSEETTVRPKPMVEIGGQPILWHIMKLYTAYGITDFVICLGYKGYVIKEFFAQYALHTSDVTFDMRTKQMHVHEQRSEPWRVTLVDTGLDTQTGGRLKRILPYVKDESAFCLTYGDAVADVDLAGLIEFHRTHGKKATVLGVRPPGRFGNLRIEGDLVTSFVEKPEGDGGWINGGFFVLSPEVADLIEGDDMIWERQPLESLAAAHQLKVYQHSGFWQPMDTLRDRQVLETLWAKGDAPWLVW